MTDDNLLPFSFPAVSLEKVTAAIMVGRSPWMTVTITNDLETY
jgi:hypothetical protein